MTNQTLTSNLRGESVFTLPPQTEVSLVTLKVASLDRSLAFYTQLIGLQELRRDEASAVLGAGERPILRLLETPGARPQPPSTTGLYHAAILWPDRHSLALKIAQLQAHGLPLGQSDHLVSEAFYLSDPDGNGLELYRDRPRHEWTWQDQLVRMAIQPIDFESFFSEIRQDDPALNDASAPVGTRLGHIHLRVAEISEAEQFYHGLLGFDVTAQMPGALFVSAGGYHHHIGMNTWESRGGQPPSAPSAGLEEFSLRLPDLPALERLADRLAAAGIALERNQATFVLHDPFQNRLRLSQG
jgi:catechol 2,3-dioxygenase